MYQVDDASANQFLSWVHLGDLHIKDQSLENYYDLQTLVNEINIHFTRDIDFVLLPGDNADGGTEDQYRLVKEALGQLHLPVQIIAGDHDKARGTLENFKKYLEPNPYRAMHLRGFQLLFLNAVDGDGFDLGEEQSKWLQEQLQGSRRSILFHHLYPSELRTKGEFLSDLIRQHSVELVEMGHTHYNELSSTGATIYAATRSTGQIEEGPPGFSITAIDDDVVSWKFNERGASPFVMITSPADHRLITKPHSPNHVVRGKVPVRVKVWGATHRPLITLELNGVALPAWELDSSQLSDGIHTLTARSEGASDTIQFLVSQSGQYHPPLRHPVDYENTVGAWPEKGILGTQLGPNENGTKGPWPSWVTR